MIKKYKVKLFWFELKNKMWKRRESVHSLSCVWLFATPWTAAPQASLSITNSQSLLKLMSIELLMPFNHLILCLPLLLLLSMFPRNRVFPNESVLTSPLFSSSILGICRPEEFIFQCHIFLPFHTVHGVLKATILKWLAIPFSSGPCFVRTLHYDPSVLVWPYMAWLKISLN